MSEPLPPPLVPADVDLRDFQYMELDVRVLRDSRFAAQVSGDAFRAGVLLWCAAWHQVPAGSLPDDDVELANLAGYGRFIKEWRKVRDEALTQFVKCSDDRLYHETVAKKAGLAWRSKLQHHYDRARERLRKANKARADKGLPVAPELSFDDWNTARIAAAIPMEKAEASAGIPQNVPPPVAGSPPENALKGNGEGTEKERNGTETSSLGESDPAAAGRRATKKCPAWFDLTPDMRQWAAENAPHVNLDAELAKLRDHTFASARTDWAGTLRNWLRKAEEQAAPPRGNTVPLRAATATERRIATIDALTGKDRSHGPAASPGDIVDIDAVRVG